MLPVGEYRTAKGSTLVVSGPHGGRQGVSFDWLEEGGCIECRVVSLDDEGYLVWSCTECGGGRSEWIRWERPGAFVEAPSPRIEITGGKGGAEPSPCVEIVGGKGGAEPALCAEITGGKGGAEPSPCVERETVFFAHGKLLAGTREAEEAEEAITQLTGAWIINPGAIKWPAEEFLPTAYQTVVEACSRVVVLEFMGHVGCGVFQQVMYAIQLGRPVHVLRDGELKPLKLLHLVDPCDWAEEFGRLECVE
jgi:hypothetical protein